ncbi:hypothetical protein M9Y10_018452 [Tritrichomonas musculus]|uniref:Transmembrane protein n=1 Tax=Tritrichomonas musculus TaxID=1915356 RepID=A0ABR2HP90_9EUKA
MKSYIETWWLDNKDEQPTQIDIYLNPNQGSLQEKYNVIQNIYSTFKKWGNIQIKDESDLDGYEVSKISKFREYCDRLRFNMKSFNMMNINSNNISIIDCFIKFGNLDNAYKQIELFNQYISQPRMNENHSNMYQVLQKYFNDDDKIGDIFWGFFFFTSLIYCAFLWIAQYMVLLKKIHRFHIHKNSQFLLTNDFPD